MIFRDYRHFSSHFFEISVAWNPSEVARMAELVDALDSKSCVLWTCGFETLSGYQRTESGIRAWKPGSGSIGRTSREGRGPMGSTERGTSEDGVPIAVAHREVRSTRAEPDQTLSGYQRTESGIKTWKPGSGSTGRTSREGRGPRKLLLRRGPKEFAGSDQENAKTAGPTNPIDALATGLSPLDRHSIDNPSSLEHQPRAS